MAMTERGEVFTFGDGTFGKLGHGNEEPCNTPTLVENLAGDRIISIAAGQHHSAFVSARGDVFTCGRGEFGQLGQGEIAMDCCLVPKRVSLLTRRGVVKVVCAASSTMALTERGTVYAWGLNQGGRLGLGVDSEAGFNDKVNAPVMMSHLDGAEIRNIACGDAHTIALSDYYCADNVPERIDQGGESLVEGFVPPVQPSSTCCIVS